MYAGRCYSDYNDKFGGCVGDSGGNLNYLSTPSDCNRIMKAWQGINITDDDCDPNFATPDQRSF